MSSIVIAGDTSGSVTLQAPAVAGLTVLNLPATSGTIQTSGAGYTTNGVAYASSTSALTTGSALTFDGTDMGIGGAPVTGLPLRLLRTSGGAEIRYQNTAATWDAGVLSTGDFEIFTGANKTIQFGVNGSEQMRLTSTGLGIGTTSPASKLNVAGTFTITGAGQQMDNGQAISMKNASGTLRQAMVVDGSNNLALGGTVDGGILFYTSTGNERARIDTSGNLLVGTTGLDGRFRVSQDGLVWARVTNHTYSGTQFFDSFRYNGTEIGKITGNNSNVSYVTSSDYRLKENIAPMVNALATVAQLKPCTYNWKLDGAEGQGFIAHELQAVVPDAVVGKKDAVNEDGSIKPQGIDTSFLVATLTAALQEAHGLIKDLETRISVLENK